MMLGTENIYPGVDWFEVVCDVTVTESLSQMVPKHKAYIKWYEMNLLSKAKPRNLDFEKITGTFRMRLIKKKEKASKG